ncbi:MAG TPA: GNAT family N-acetyltransferase [Actinomycetes bacterium]|nr:GNAT family N-acetyltransferase [Actinomycetes bacterium]
MTLPGQASLADVSIVRIDAVDADSLQAVRALVAEAELPLAGIEDASAIFGAYERGELAGTVAIEEHGEGEESANLLRSLAVRPDARDRGVGRQLVRHVLESTNSDRPLALLTESATTYFERLGFVAVPREALPPSLNSSVELSEVCPSTAQAMIFDSSVLGARG